MQVHVLVVPDCPHAEPATAVARRALDEFGLNHVWVTTILVTSQAQAEQLQFAGSPTVMIDGHDPFAGPASSPGLSCRLYRDGITLTGTPPLEPIKHAIRQAMESRTDTGDRAGG
jgi:hypothetical protein